MTTPRKFEISLSWEGEGAPKLTVGLWTRYGTSQQIVKVVPSVTLLRILQSWSDALSTSIHSLEMSSSTPSWEAGLLWELRHSLDALELEQSFPTSTSESSKTDGNNKEVSSDALSSD